MKIEPALSIDARRAQLEQIEYSLNIRIKPIISLAGEGDVALAQVGDGFAGVTVQLRFGSNAIFGRILAIVTLVVVGRRDALVIRRDDAGTQHGRNSRPMIQLGYGVGLGQILCRIANILNYAEI